MELLNVITQSPRKIFQTKWLLWDFCIELGQNNTKEFVKNFTKILQWVFKKGERKDMRNKYFLFILKNNKAMRETQDTKVKEH